MLAISTVDHGFEPRSDKTEDYKIDKVLFAKYSALKRKKTKTTDNVSEWNEMSICRLLWRRGDPVPTHPPGWSSIKQRSSSSCQGNRVCSRHENKGSLVVVMPIHFKKNKRTEMCNNNFPVWIFGRHGPYVLNPNDCH